MKQAGPIALFGVLSLVAVPSLGASPQQGVAAGAGGGSGPWSLQLSLNESYDTNVRFRAIQPDRSDANIVSRLGAGLSRSFQGPRHSLGLTASANRIWYSKRNTLNRQAYSLGASLSLQPSARLSLSLRDTYTATDTTELDELTTEGILLPNARFRRNRASAGLDYQLSDRTSLSLAGVHEQTSFDQSILVGGGRLSGSASLNRQLGVLSSGSLAYRFQARDRRGIRTYLHSGSLGWSRPLGASTRMSLSAGFSHAELEARSANFVSGSASLARSFRWGGLGFDYTRGLALSVGLGSERVVDAFNGHLNAQLTQTLNLFLRASYGRNQDPLLRSNRFGGLRYSAGLGWVVTRQLSVSGQYAFARRDRVAELGDVGSGPSPTAQRASLGITYRTSF